MMTFLKLFPCIYYEIIFVLVIFLVGNLLDTLNLVNWDIFFYVMI